MEIDSPHKDEQFSVFIHPLALIHMSDQYTRIRCGGSPLPSSTPVVGIMFGSSHAGERNSSNNNKNALSGTTSYYVEDAEEIDLQDAAQQIELHRTVFPKQSVLGWYKVVDDVSTPGSTTINEPTLDDLKQTQQIRKMHKKKNSDSPQDDTADYVSKEIFFGLLRVPKQKEKSSSSASVPGVTEEEESKADADDEDELPLTIYQLDPKTNGTSLVALPSWSLKTAEAERIAVQRVIREKATLSTTPVDSTTSDDSKIKSAKGSKKKQQQQQSDVSLPQQPQQPIEHSIVLPYIDEVAESCKSIAARLTTVLEFLEQQQPALWTGAAAIDDNTAIALDPQVNLPLLRQVQGLLLQLGPIASATPSGAGVQQQRSGDPKDADAKLSGTKASMEARATFIDKTSKLQQLAKLSHAVQAVTMYTENFKYLQEHSGRGGGSGGSSSREMRRY